MTNTKKLSLLSLCAALAIPALASAEPRRDSAGWTRLGEVGTHRHDAEDYIPVQTNERIESLELISEGRPVFLDAIKVQYVDGREYRADVNWRLRPGARALVDIPAYSPIKMIVLEYDNPGRHFRAREDARVEVRGLTANRQARDDRRGYYQRDRRTDRRADDRRVDDRRADDRRVDDRRHDVDTRFEWRGNIYVRVR